MGSRRVGDRISIKVGIVVSFGIRVSTEVSVRNSILLRVRVRGRICYTQATLPG